jgi:hypothetical protein
MAEKEDELGHFKVTVEGRITYLIQASTVESAGIEALKKFGGGNIIENVSLGKSMMVQGVEHSVGSKCNRCVPMPHLNCTGWVHLTATTHGTSMKCSVCHKEL